MKDGDNKAVGWEDDIPLYRAGIGPGYTVYAGTNYPVRRAKKSLLVVRVVFDGQLEELPRSGIADVAWASMVRRSKVAAAYQSDLLLGQADTLQTIPANAPAYDQVLVFWFSPFVNAARPSLAIRARYRASTVATLKQTFASERLRLKGPRIGAYLPDWGRLWCVDDWRAIPVVLGALQARGLRLAFVARHGFPEAPPLAVVVSDGVTAAEELK